MQYYHVGSDFCFITGLQRKQTIRKLLNPRAENREQTSGSN